MAAGTIICTQENGALGFGDHKLPEKAKAGDFNHKGDIYKVKTHSAMTKLEKNDMFVYESVPGTTVKDFVEDEKGMSFKVCGGGDAQIILGLEDGAEYSVFVDGQDMGKVKTNLSGKLNVSAMLSDDHEVEIKVSR